MQRGKIVLLILLVIFLINGNGFTQERPSRSTEYAAVQKKLARGWNTWNTTCVLSHALLPHGLAINLQFKDNDPAGEQFLYDALIGGNPETEIKPVAHAYDGSYTELELHWRNVHARIQSAWLPLGDFVVLITPLQAAPKPPLLVAAAGMLWNRPGQVSLINNNMIRATLPETTISIYCTRPPQTDANVPLISPYLAMPLDIPAGISTGKSRTIGDIITIIENQRNTFNQAAQEYGALADVYKALQTVTGWNTIYDPQNDRVIVTSSRIENRKRGGWSLSGWDAFLAAYLTAIDNKYLAYANIREALNQKTTAGFVPGLVQGNGYTSGDRSHPPIGALTVWRIYQKFREKWLLEQTFDELFAWNRWWDIYRNYDGLLCWGSLPSNTAGADAVQADRTAALMESRMADSPVYRDVPFNETTQLLEVWDVGLNSLYIADSKALWEMAVILGRKSEEKELKNRVTLYQKNLDKLWDDSTGMYLNIRTDTDEKITRISPANFYPLLAGAPSEKRATRMIEEHLMNPNKFWTVWALPSLTGDSTLTAGDSSQIHISAPFNLLVYLGLKNYNFTQAHKDLAEKSKTLLMRAWQEKNYICEYYDPQTGAGIETGDCFYQPSALLGLIALIEGGYYKNPE
ncbi:MAG TPA: trehalase family glycosidase [bacterium]|nr:trehalase family glycosidase [bacterium]HPN46138.1 trehalase family glycosidase [bacterium]